MKFVEILVDERIIGFEKFGVNLDMKKILKFIFFIFRYEKNLKFIFVIFF